MGDVYLAVHKGPGGFYKLSIIKELRSSFAEDGTSLAMFLDEARLAARLSHPNVVQTNEVGCEDGRHFMVMEYLEGKPFHHVLKGLGPAGAFPWPLRVHVLCEALKGLHYAHELKDFDGTHLNVVHRDFTPHNIFVTYEGVVKVLDFGIAKAVDSQETRAGVIKGKVAYMAPEQAMGKTIDRRADVFSAGVMLWEAITNRRMWQNLSEVQILVQMLQETPPAPIDVNPEVPEELSRICMRALARDVDERYETCEQLRLDLENFLEIEGLRAVPSDIAQALQRGFEKDRQRVQGIVENAMRELRSSPSDAGPISLSPESTTHSSIRTSPSVGVVPGMADVRDLTQGHSGLLTGPTYPLQAPLGEDFAVKPRRGKYIALAGVLALGAIGTAFAVRSHALSSAPPAAAVATGPGSQGAGNLAKVDPPKPAATGTGTAATAPEVAFLSPAEKALIDSSHSKGRSVAATSTATATAKSEAIALSHYDSKDAPPSTAQPTTTATTTSPSLNTPAPTVATAPTVVPFSSQMARPMQLSGHDPIYPSEARNAGVEGTMVAKCIITVKGSVTDCRILKSLPYMDKPVLDALYSRKYTPVIFEGGPTAVSYIFNIRIVRPK